MKSDIGAEFLSEVAHFGAAQHHIERPVHRVTLTLEDVVGHGLLRGSHLCIGQWLEAIATQSKVGRGWGLRAGDGYEGDQAGADKCAPHQYVSFLWADREPKLHYLIGGVSAARDRF